MYGILCVKAGMIDHSKAICIPIYKCSVSQSHFFSYHSSHLALAIHLGHRGEPPLALSAAEPMKCSRA